MDKRDNFNFNNGSALHKDTDTNKSFVKKVRSRVTGLLSTSLSKWFGGNEDQKATVRYRDEEEEDDDETFSIQPPSKRIKIPTPESNNTYINSFPSSTYTNDLNTRTINYASNSKTTFEPVAGPSGIQSYKCDLESSFSKDNLLNGDKDSESGESMDDTSSRLAFSHSNNIINDLASNRERRNIFNSTSPPAGHNRSLFSDRTSTPQLNTSLSLRRPSFNASTFGSPNFVDRTLSTKRILNSPFYKGRTIYGGASAYTAQNRSNIQRQTRNQIQVKPVNNSSGSDAGLSETARRILHALEEFRSPLLDAKKVPPPTKRSRPEGILSKYTGANPYLKDHKIPLALNKELQVPTVPDLLKLKLKERLQDSTVAVRQIATTSKSELNKDDYKIRTEEDTPKHSNKIKNKITSTRQSKPESQAEEVKLPNIALPITTLPKFEFSLPLPPSNSKQPLITVACNAPPKATDKTPPKKLEEIETKVDGDNVQYKFSNPLVLAENLVSIIAINDFNVQLKRKVPSEAIQPAVKSSKDSVEDVFSKTDILFKPSADTWECSVCLIRNVPEKSKCAACENPKPQISKKETTKTCFANQLNTGKSDSNVETNSTKDGSFVKDNKINGPIVCNPTTFVNHSFGDKFKVPDSMWTCSTCMITNKNELDKCAACETAKPGTKSSVNSNGFGEAFMKKSSEWECSICMIRNPNEKEACVACETPKPGTKPVAKVQNEENIPKFNFGIFPSKSTTITSTTPSVIPTLITPSTTSSALPTFTFGIPEKQAAPPSVPSVTVEVTKVTEPPDTVDASTTKTDKPSETVNKSKLEESVAVKPITQPELPKPFVPTTTGFTFGNLNKPKDDVKSTLTPTKPTDHGLSKPIILSPPQSAFTITPNVASTTTELKKDPVVSSASSIIFSPPKVDSNPLKPSMFAPQTNLLNPEKNLFGVVPKNQTTSVAATTQTSAPTTNSFSFVTPQTQPQTTTTVPANLFSFAPKTTSSSLFGNATTVTPAPMFKFNQPEPTNTPQPSFGVTAETQQQGSMFTKPTTSIFGIASKTPFEAPSSVPVPAFGVTTSAFGTEIKPTGFGTEIKPNISGFGTEIKAPTFGSDVKQPTAPPAFGSELKHPAPPPAFGSEMKPSLPPPPFGTTTDVKPFSFGARASEEPTKPVFSFGAAAAAKAPEPAKPVAFGFGNSAAQPSQPAAPSGGFSFNSNNNNANPAPSFNFSTPKIETASPFQSPASNIFNTPLSTQTQSLQNGGFNFGSTPSTNNNMKTGFNFGATNQFNATPAAPAPASSGVFSFGSNPNPQPQPATGGFNFVQNAAPPSAFNANMKPNFNFTAGNSPAAFSATSDNNSLSTVQRRRLKAVRRNPR
ncbi:hypothetical protein FQR65_LT09023 [Abscondita terminalis]|nr:hypothetical protein FQR65_LT09023 [Abscondita terminalis]